MSKIACVIVTYNRKNLLKNCLNAVSKQSFKPVSVYILDNASTDGTIESVKEWGYYNTEKNNISFKYILNDKNEGSSGGQYLGMKTAFEDDEYDGIWVMDDDGVPDQDCLKLLVNYLPSRDYISPFVRSIENPDLEFGIKQEKCSSIIARHPEGIVEGAADPFNGILYSARLIRKIGYPKRDMFIWGDETNYHYRAIRAGMPPIMILFAKHYHPASRQRNFVYNGRDYSDINVDWKLYCYLRNKWYNRLIFSRNKVKASFSALYEACLYYNSYKKFKHMNEGHLIIDALCCAFLGKFDGLKKYMK